MNAQRRSSTRAESIIIRPFPALAVDVIGAVDAGMVRRFEPSQFAHGFLLEEAVRFFNFGSRAQASYYVTKRLQPITGESFEVALAELGETMGTLSYLQLEAIFNLASSRFREMVAVQDPFVDLTVRDWYLRCWILPKLYFDRRWISRSAAEDVPDISELAALLDGVLTDLARTHALTFVDVVQDFERRVLVAPEWIGSPYCFVGRWGDRSGQGFLAQFCRADEAGLTEKIYATLCLLRGRGLALDNPSVPWGKYRRLSNWMSAMHWRAQSVARELGRLRSGVYGARLAQPPQLLRWLDDLDAVERILLAALSRAREVALSPSSRDRAEAIESDLVWGLILAGYLRNYLLRAILLAFVAAFPFAAIHHGGTLRRLGKAYRYQVPGIIGPLGVSLWEAFGGDTHPSCFHESAWDGASPFSAFRVGDDRVDSSAPLEPSETLLGGPPRGPRFDDTYELELGDFISAGTRRIHAATRLAAGPRGGSSAPTALQRLAHDHHGHGPMTDEQIAKRVSTSPGRLLSITYSEGSVLPQVERLPVPFLSQVAENPPYLDRFFDITCFNKWPDSTKVQTDQGEQTVTFGRSSLIFGAPITVQLQTYVAGWLYPRAFEESGAKSNWAGLTDEVKFTCASIQWGGKFPPHITHRDGYGYDWGLFGSKDKPVHWHWSTHWPRDNQTTKVKAIDPVSNQEVTETRTYAAELLGLEYEHSNLARTLRIVLGDLDKPVRDRGRTKAENATATSDRRATVEKIVAEVLREVPAAFVHKKLRISDIPRDVIIGRPPSGKPCRPIYRELVTRRLSETFRAVDDHFRSEREFDSSTSEQFFDELDARLAGLPVFHDADSHELHHLAHTCVVLSGPGEIVWGAPVYHLRALRAIYFELREHPWNPFVRRKQANGPRLTSLPLPRFHFLPHDHHHHWHVQYWGDITAARLRSSAGLDPQISDHASFVRACLPLWMALGVEMQPFLEYLEEYARRLGDVRPNPSAMRVLASIAQLRDDILRAADEYAVDAANAKDLRRDLFSAARALSKTPASEDWPPPQSITAEVVKLSDTIMKRVKFRHDDYTDNEAFDGQDPELHKLDEEATDAVRDAGDSDVEFIREKLVNEQAPADEPSAHDSDAQEHEGITQLPDERGGQPAAGGE